jgi:hypothetical protein
VSHVKSLLMEMVPTEQDTYDHIFGSGFDTYSWWGQVRTSWDMRNPAPDGWTAYVPVEDGDTGEWRTAMVTHSLILGAMEKLAEGDVKYATDSVARECREFLKGPEDADFDAGTADEVMQMVTLGEIIYG